MKIKLLLSFLLIIMLPVLPAGAAPLKVFVSGVSAVGVPNRAEMQTTLQTLLASRLASDSLLPVSSAAEADVIVSGSYLVFGKVFSLDAVATTAAGKTITRSYLDGEGQDELIPVVGRLAQKLSVAILQSQGVAAATPSQTAPVAEARPAAAVTEGAPPAGDIIKLKSAAMASSGSFRSLSLTGVLNLVAAGTVRADSSRDVFLAGDHTLFYYRQGKELQLLATKELKLYEKIIALDTLDAGTGSVELYLTVVSNGQLASQIWQTNGDSLQLVAAGLPYFFRTVELPGKPRKLYVQKSGNDRTFSGEVFEAERSGTSITLKSPLKLPSAATIYSFAQFSDRSGNLFTAVINSDNNLVVYNRDLGEIWRSSEKYGGSELYMEMNSIQSASSSEGSLPKVYMNQRMQATADGGLLVGKNDAYWFLGKSRNYRNGTVFCLQWNGESLVGKWQTRDSEYYLPSFYYDDPRKELLVLEVTQKENILSKGASAISIKKVE